MATNTKAAPGTDVAVYSEDLLTALAPLLDSVPWRATGDGSEMALRILEADSWEDLNDGGKMPSVQSLAPCRLKVTAVSKAESDLEGGFPVYLILEGTNLTTGQPLLAQTGAGQVFLKLVKLAAFDALPAVVQITRSDKATAAGFYPLNLIVEGATPAGSK